MIFRKLLPVIAVLLIASCGGGGGGGGSGGGGGGGNGSSGTTSSSLPAKIDQTPLVFTSQEISSRLNQDITNPLSGGAGTGVISYSSSNPNVAIIDETGKITLTGIGSTTITAKKTGDSTYKDASTSFLLNVAKKIQDTFQFQLNSFALILGDAPASNTITGGSGTGAIIYRIEDTTIATVDSITGSVTPLTSGTTRVIAIKEADATNEQAETSYSLTINKQLQNPLAFKQTNIEKTLGGLAFFNPVSGGSGSGELIYSSSDESIVNIDKVTGKTILLAEGKTTIRATKAGNETYLPTFAEYTLDVSIIVNELIADVGKNETLFSWKKQSGAVSLFRTTDEFCNLDNINHCQFGQELYIGSTNVLPIKDNILNILFPGFVAIANNKEISRLSLVNKKTPEFSRRTDPELINFNNKLFLIGGVQNGDQYLCNNEIWTSDDGITWILSKKNAEFSARNAHQVVEFSGSLWLYGGEECIGTGGASQYRSDLWRSEDGVNWTQVYLNNYMSAREDHSFVVFNGKMWIYGGSYDNKEIWASADGSTWEKVVTNAPFGSRTGQQMFVFKNKLWLVGGLTFGPPDFETKNDVWSSSDGINWIKETENTGFSKRLKHQIVVFKDVIYLLGGNGNNGNSFNESWRSTDGVNWTLMSSNVVDYRLSSSQVIVFNDYLWLLENNYGYSLWRSVNGITWYVPMKIPLNWNLRQ